MEEGGAVLTIHVVAGMAIVRRVMETSSAEKNSKRGGAKAPSQCLGLLT